MDTIFDTVVGMAFGAMATFAYLQRVAITPVRASIPDVLAPAPRSTTGPNTDYIRFHYRDGRVEVKKFRSTDIGSPITWKGRNFNAGEWTSDGHIYHEVD